MQGNVEVGCMVLGMVQTNCYLIYRKPLQEREAASEDAPQADASVPCILVDPGDQGALVYERLTEKGFRIELILLTHAHFDHIGGVEELRKRSGAPVYCYEAERPLCENAEVNRSAAYGIPMTVEPDRYLKDGETIEAAGLRCELIATPGHTVGSCCYYFAEEGILICGDTLFEGSVGRTDLPTGSMRTLVRSIRERLFALPDETVAYPGHGGLTTIGREKQYNPFV